MWDAIEGQVRDRLTSGDAGAAAEAVIAQASGPLFGYIARICGDDDTAADAFQTFSLRLWEALPEFQWRASLRTYVYAIARNAAYGAVKDPFDKRGQRLGTQEQEALVGQWQRTATARWQQTREKSRLWTLIAALDPEDRELMVLRVGRKMSWNDVAQVMAADGEADAEQLKRQAASARKRYERIKAKLAAEMAT